jgi:DNA-binding CsgD family transcriptional regulator
MPDGVLSRSAKARAVTEFLASATVEPSALVIEGEPGIGKTTLWLAATAEARERGFTVLSARPSAAESVLAYAALADLLGGIDAAAWARLPDPQRLAVDRVLLRAKAADGSATDQRAVAAGVLSIVEILAEAAPVLVAIDDLQWLDPSSMQVVAFAVRRLSARVGVLAAVRTDPAGGGSASWLQLPRPDAIHRIRVAPLSLGGLHAVVSERLGHSFPRPALVRIQEISGGNPFYALELARPMHEGATGADGLLPSTLAELVRMRIGRLDPDVEEILLAAACLAAPTVELVARATRRDVAHVEPLLADAEATAIVGIDGHRLRFTHPLLAHGVYTEASPKRRRAMHRRLADIVEEPELAARHLALGVTTAHPRTLRSLDAAAEAARNRGAPAAAAELLNLAIGLGGDTPARRIAVAGHHLGAGDIGRARDLLRETIDALPPGPQRAEASSMLGFVHLFGDSFTDAAAVLERALDEAGDDLALRTRLLTTLAYARYNGGRFGAATASIEDAVTHAERLGQPHPLSQALSMRVVLRFLRGDGLDEADLARALELEDRDANMPMAFRPSMQNAMLAAWTGRLDAAHREMASIRRRCIEHGEENELIFVAVHSFLCEIWRANFADAALIAEDTMERASQLGGDVPLFVALTMRGTLAAYAGGVDEARRDIVEALAASRRCGANLLVVWPITSLGFLEVSLANHDAALAALDPLLYALEAAPHATEIVAAAFIPDAVEALLARGRLADAEPLLNRLNRDGARLDRAWMLAVGGRCRAMLLAARGDVNAASLAALQAMAEHDRLPMPFERARTQLLLGQLQRRGRHTDAAAATLREALCTFEELNTPLWADRARAELGRTNAGPRQSRGLTPSEQRVADLAASGMTNRDVAVTLFISPKTVEANLSRIYRKLGIHSRAELGGHFSAGAVADDPRRQFTATAATPTPRGSNHGETPDVSAPVRP